MTSDSAPLEPAPQNWLTTDLKYPGWGKAEFTDPPAIIEGPALVRVNRLGEQTVTIDVKNPPVQGWAFYVKGSGPLSSIRKSGWLNPCASVMVSSQDGLFTATERVWYDGGNSKSNPHRIRLRSLRSQYEVNGSAKAAWWVLPLSNFILAHWPRPSQDLDAHPLRVVPTSIRTDTPPEGQRPETEQPIRARDRLVTFMLNGQPGFIEPLPDYKKQVERLQKGKIANAINAVMVGPAHVESVSFSDYGGLFPLDVLPLMTLATGGSVGAPWVEFRDENGRLVRRIHIQFGSPPYQRRVDALLGFLPKVGLGELLTRMFSSPERGKNYLRVAMNRAISASKQPQTLEDRFVSLVRAFETLCYHYGLGTQDLMVSLDVLQQNDVKKVLTAASAEIRALRIGETAPDRRGALERIASRAGNAANKEKDFGMAMIDLTRRFALSDADILEAHLTAHTIASTDSWAGLLSKLRGAVTHEAYFELPSGRHDLDEILMVTDHLHDLLLRILFKILGYSGMYQPQTPLLPRFEQVDWVTPATPAAFLGYH